MPSLSASQGPRRHPGLIAWVVGCERFVFGELRTERRKLPLGERGCVGAEEELEQREVAQHERLRRVDVQPLIQRHAP